MAVLSVKAWDTTRDFGSRGLSTYRGIPTNASLKSFKEERLRLCCIQDDVPEEFHAFLLI